MQTENFYQYRKEIENGFQNIEDLMTGLYNFRYINSHVKKFGVTKEFIDLCDSEKQLSFSLKVDLQENDDVEVFSESIGEAVKTIIEKVKSFFKWIWEKFLSFLSFFSSKRKNKIEVTKQVKEVIKDKISNVDKLKETKCNFIKYEKLLSFMDICINFNKNLSRNLTEENQKKINEHLQYVGKRFELDEDRNIKIVDDRNFMEGFFQKEEGDLYSLGYNSSHIDNLFKKYQNNSDIDKFKIELEQKEKDILKQLNEVNKPFTPSVQLENAVKNRDLHDIYSIFTFIIHNDPSFVTSKFTDTLEYVKRHNIPDFIKPFDGRPLELKEKWNEEYRDIILSSLATNFSEERINHLKEVSKFLYKDQTYQYQLNQLRVKMNLIIHTLGMYDSWYGKFITIVKEIK